MRKGQLVMLAIVAALNLLSTGDRRTVPPVPSQSYYNQIASQNAQISPGYPPTGFTAGKQTPLQTQPGSSTQLIGGSSSAATNRYEPFYSPPQGQTTFIESSAPAGASAGSPSKGSSGGAQDAGQSSSAAPIYYLLGGTSVGSGTTAGTNTTTQGQGSSSIAPQGSSGSGNGPPVIDSFVPTNTTPSVNEGGSIIFSVSASDPDGDALSYAWQLDTTTQAGISNTWTYRPDYNSSGTHAVTVTVSDGSLTAQKTWAVAVNDLSPPSGEVFITGIQPDNGIPGQDVTIQGSGFSANAQENVVMFGDTRSGLVSVVSSKQIRARVPQGIAPGFKDVMVTAAGKNSNLFSFDILQNGVSRILSDETQVLLPTGFSMSDSSVFAIGDVDRDMDLDIFAIDGITGRLYLLVNNGSGVFSDGSSARLANVQISNTITSAAMGDIDGDGYPDILLSCSDGQAVRLLLNDGQGRFSEMTGANLPAVSGVAVSLDIGDSNGDGYPDIAIANKDSKDVLLLNTPAAPGIFSKDAQFNLPDAIDGSSDIEFCDINGDGNLDIITANNQIVSNSSLRPRAYVNNGSGGFTDGTDTFLPEDDEYSEALDSGDIDGDMDIDIVIANHRQNALLVFNSQRGSYEDMSTHMPVNSFASTNTKLGDLNGDGSLDIVMLGEEKISLFLNNGLGSFDDMSIKLPDYRSSPALAGGANMALCDINGDGHLDIIIGNGSLRVFMSRDENKAPVLNPIGNRSVEVGSLLTFNVAAIDPNGDALEYLTENLPTGATITSGIFRWTPVIGDLGEHQDIRFTARENVAGRANPLQASETIKIRVAQNRAPVLTVSPPQNDLTVNGGDSWVFTATATDPDNDPVTISWKVNGQSIGATQDNFSMMSVIFGTGNHVVEVKATDSKGASSSFVWQVHVLGGTGTNRPPVIDETNPVTAEVPVINVRPGGFATQEFRVVRYHDPDPGQSVSFSWQKKPAGGSYTDIPGMTGQGGFIALTPGEHYIKVTLTDNGSPNWSTSFEWHVTIVESAQNSPPVIDATNPAVAEVPTIYVRPGGFASQEFRVTQYHDPDSGQSVSFSWQKKPAGGSYADIPNMIGQGGFIALTPGEYYIKVTLTDNGSPNLSTSFEWHVTIVESDQNHAPVIDAKTPANAEIGTVYVAPGASTTQSFSITQYHDPDSGDTVSFNWEKKVSGGSYEQIPGVQGQTANVTLSAGDHFIKITLTDDGNPNMSTSFEWHIIVSESTQNHAPVIDAKAPANAEIPAVYVAPGASATQNFAVTQYHDPDTGDLVSFSWFRKTSGGSYEQIAGATSQSVSAEFGAGEYYVKVVLTDNAASPMSTSFEWHLTVSERAEQAIIDQVIKSAFPYFWVETDNPSTGFVRDRVTVNPANRNSNYDTRYDRASMAATGFGLAGLCVAAEKYGDGTNPDWRLTPAELRQRAELILDKLLEIQSNQNPNDEASLALWGKDGLFYHFVNVNDGKRWPGSEVSTIDTAILVSGALTAGEYFGGTVKDKALQIYRNVDWKAFLDTNQTVQNHHVAANPYFNQMYHAWDPDRPANDRYFGHWDYTSEGILLYLLASSTPAQDHAIPADTFYAMRRVLGNYGQNGMPMVKSWFGPLFVYQYTQAFFRFQDQAGQALYDKQGVDWWANSVEATKANKQYCNDNIALFAGEVDLWGLTSGYTNAFTYTMYGAPPAGMPIPHQDVHGADGTVFPAAVGGSIPMLATETVRSLNKMKELYDVYNHPVWGDYGFVNSFRMGSNIGTLPFPISDFYCGIDTGVTLAMAENYKSGLIWNKFSSIELSSGVTMRDKLIQTTGLSADRGSIIALDDIGPTSNFRMGYVDPVKNIFRVQFDMQNIGTKPYLLSIHSYMDKALGDHSVTVKVKVNDASPFNVTFDYSASGKDPDLMKYIQINGQDLKAGTNVILIEWLSSTNNARWLAWKNVEISSAVEHSSWSMARDEAVNPMVLFGNEYRVDDTYFVGADVKSMAQAINKDVENFTDIMFYSENAQYGEFTMRVLESQDNRNSNVRVFVNGSAEPVFDAPLASGQQVTTGGFYLRSGWNRITLYHPGVGDGNDGEWIRWDVLSFTEKIPPVLQAPADFVGASFGKTKAKLRWQSVNGAAKYHLYRASGQGGPYTRIAAVTAPGAAFVDDNNGQGLTDNTPYYYVVRSVSSTDAESQDSREIKITTGPYQNDYGDGHDTNSFGGYTLNNGGIILGDSAYVETDRYNDLPGKVRKMVLADGQKNAISLANANISDATIFSFRIRTDSGGDKFFIRLKDSAGSSTSVLLTSPVGGIWQEMHFYINNTFQGVDLSNLDSLEVVSGTTGQQITVYLDEIEFATVAMAGDRLDIKIKDGLMDGQTTALDFGAVTPDKPIVLANQYLEINYVSSGTWGIQIYTNNKADDANPRFTGSGNKANGLVGEENSAYRVAIIWQVWQEKKNYYGPGGNEPEYDTTVDDGDRAEFAFVMDRSDSDWAIDQYVRNYRTLINSNGELGAPVPLATPITNPPGYWPRIGVVGNPVYVYLAANFTGAPAQRYTTSKLMIDIYRD